MSDPATPPRSLKGRLILALLAAFACGAVAGGAGVWLGARCGLAPFSQAPHGFRPPGFPPGRPEDMAIRLADKLCNELSLDESLREPIRQIFREGFVEAEPIRQRSGDAMKAVFTRQNERIKALLTPEQKRRFDELLADWEKRHGPPPR